MNGRKLSVPGAVSSLRRKGVMFGTGLDEKEIDLSRAKNMGNKSWGLVDFLVNHNHYSIVKKIISPSTPLRGEYF